MWIIQLNLCLSISIFGVLDMSEANMDEYVNMELNYAEALKKTVKDLRNPVIKTIIESISRDSVKHAMIYKTIGLLLKGEGALISEEEAEWVLKEIEQHIKSEEEMIRNVKSMLEGGINNKAVRFLLEAILKDEVIHHSMLKRVYEIIVKQHTLTESDIWDMVWKDVSFHGTPGG